MNDTLSTDWKWIKVTPSGQALGADLEVPDIAHAGPETWAEIERAVIRHQVVRLRGLDLQSAEVVAVSRKLGDPTVRGQNSDVLATPPGRDPAVSRKDAKLTDERFPEIGAVSNVVEDGKAKGAYGSLQLHWHSDMVTAEYPATYTVLYAVEAPSGEGQTVFTSTHAAAEALPPERLAELSALTLKNSRAANAAGLIEGFEPITDVTTSPGRVHPLVTVHPATGRPNLFLGRRMHAYIPGLPVEESERVLEEVWTQATLPEFQWTQDWRPGDLVIFDNRGLLHRREPFSPDKRRLLQQIVLRGTEPPVPYRPGDARQAA